MAEFLATARAAQRSVLAGTTSSGDLAADLEVWNGTAAEIERGWARGPLTPEELNKKHGGAWVAARRFGLHQRGGLRLTDDFSEHRHNDVTSCSEKIDVGGINDVAGFCKTWLQYQAGGRFKVELATSEVKERAVHAEFGPVGSRRC